MIKNISNLGDAALYCDFGNDVNKEINSNVIQFFKNIQKSKIPGVINITPSYNKLIISFDLNITNFDKIKTEVEQLNFKNEIVNEGKLIKIPVCCDNDFALDIKRFLSPRQITFAFKNLKKSSSSKLKNKSGPIPAVSPGE